MDIFKTIFAFSMLILFGMVLGDLMAGIIKIETGNIAIIKIIGEISGSPPLFGSGTSSETVLENLDKADKDPNVKAIFLEINSPGGTVVASKEIAQKLESINKTKVAFIREEGASGAYWVASAADKIVAFPLSITGSIGVSSSYLEFSGLFDKYGIGYVRLVSGEQKDIGTPYRKPTQEEISDFQKIINAIYEDFVKDVARYRKMDVDRVKSLADGRVYLGKDAKDLGLVDYLGDKDFALNMTKSMANLTEIYTVGYTKQASIMDIISGIFGSSQVNPLSIVQNAENVPLALLNK